MARGQAKVNICSFKGFQRLQWAMKLLHAGREAAADEKPKEQVPQAAGESRTSLCTAQRKRRKGGGVQGGGEEDEKGSRAEAMDFMSKLHCSYSWLSLSWPGAKNSSGQGERWVLEFLRTSANRGFFTPFFVFKHKIIYITRNTMNEAYIHVEKEGFVKSLVLANDTCFPIHTHTHTPPAPSLFSVQFCSLVLPARSKTQSFPHQI